MVEDVEPSPRRKTRLFNMQFELRLNRVRVPGRGRKWRPLPLIFSRLPPSQTCFVFNSQWMHQYQHNKRFLNKCSISSPNHLECDLRFHEVRMRNRPQHFLFASFSFRCEVSNCRTRLTRSRAGGASVWHTGSVFSTSFVLTGPLLFTIAFACSYSHAYSFAHLTSVASNQYSFGPSQVFDIYFHLFRGNDGLAHTLGTRETP